MRNRGLEGRGGPIGVTSVGTFEVGKICFLLEGGGEEDIGLSLRERVQLPSAFDVFDSEEEELDDDDSIDSINVMFDVVVVVGVVVVVDDDDDDDATDNATD